MPVKGRALPLIAALVVVISPIRVHAQTEDTPRPPVAIEVEKFTDDDAKALAKARENLENYRRQILLETSGSDESKRYVALANRWAAEVRRLEDKQRNWREYLIRTSGTSEMPEWGFFTMRLPEFDKHERALARGEFTLDGPGWERQADFYGTFRRYGYAQENDKNTPYAMRAALIEAECWLFASRLHLRAGNREDHLRTYLIGVTILEDLFAVTGSYSEEKTGYLPQERPGGVKESWWYAGSYSGPGGGTYPVPTRRKAAELLAEYCPWDREVFLFFQKTGYLDGFDWKILRPYADGAVNKLWERSIQSLPAGVEEDGDLLSGGRLKIGENEIGIDWERPPKTTYSVWFFSPTVYDMKASEFLKWAVRGVKLFEGLFGLLIDETAGVALAWMEKEMGANHPIYVASGYAFDTKRSGLLSFEATLKPSDIVKLKPESMPYKSSRMFLQGAAKYLEEKETEYLFESIDPQNKTLQWYLGNPKTFDGRAMPPVLMRLDALGFLRTDPVDYRRTLHIVRHYRFDVRSLLGGIPECDLTRMAIMAVAREQLYLAGNEDLQRATWRVLPNSPAPWGTRIFDTDFSPKGQIARVTFAQKTLEKWRREMGGEEDLVAVLEAPGAFRKELARQEIKGDSAMFWIFNMRIPLEWQPYDPAHPSEGVSFRTDRPFVKYKIKIGYVERGQSGEMKLEDEKESFEVRFLPGDNEPLIGEVSYPHNGWVRIDLDRSGETGTPEGARFSLLPPGIRIERIDEKSGKLEFGDLSSGEGDIDATLAPVDPSWYKLVIDDGKRKWHMWDKVDRLSAAAVFKATIPLAPGETKLVFSTEKAASVTVTAVMGPEKGEDELIRTWLNSISNTEKAMAEDKSRGRMDDYYMHLHTLLDDHMRLAKMYISARMYGRAWTSASLVIARTPTASEAAQSRRQNAAAEFDRLKREALELSAYLYFREGGIDQMTKQSFEACLMWKKENSERLQGKDQAKAYRELADKYGTLISRIILLGADAAQVSHLMAGFYIPNATKAGYYDAKYDKFGFRYGQEDVNE